MNLLSLWWITSAASGICPISANAFVLVEPARRTRWTTKTTEQFVPIVLPSVFNENIDAALDEEHKDISLMDQLLGPGISMALLIAAPLPAVAFGGGVIPTSLGAYAHYASAMAALGAAAAQRTILKPGLSKEDENILGTLNILYVVAIAVILFSGNVRIEFEKGVAFYLHETLFWLKMALVGVQVGLSIFPAVTLVRRQMNRDEEYKPMSDELVKRMQQVLNAEISGLLFIPMLGSLMARGVLYVDGFPWQAGLALVLLGLGGSSYLYAKQALTWNDDEVASRTLAKN